MDFSFGRRPISSSFDGFRACLPAGRDFERISRIILICGISVLAIRGIGAAAATDTDGDGISDSDEQLVYYTDQWNGDSDGDGYADGVEISTGYSPRVKGKKMEEVDSDQDGLNDSVEIALRTNIINKDSDGDGYADLDEVNSGHSPASTSAESVPKRVEISLKTNRLSYYFGTVKMGEFPVSPGIARMPTPTGEFRVAGKYPKAWSRSSKLWMPWWMNFTGKGARAGAFGIHELPIWPGGRREGLSVLGKPASHGCVRLGIGPAKTLYDFAPVGTPVIISKN